MDCSSNHTPFECGWAPLTLVPRFPGKAHRPREEGTEKPTSLRPCHFVRFWTGRQGTTRPPKLRVHGWMYSQEGVGRPRRRFQFPRRSLEHDRYTTTLQSSFLGEVRTGEKMPVFPVSCFTRGSAETLTSCGWKIRHLLTAYFLLSSETHTHTHTRLTALFPGLPG